MSTFALPSLLRTKPTLAYHEQHRSMTLIQFQKWSQWACLALTLLFSPLALTPKDQHSAPAQAPSLSIEEWMDIHAHQSAYDKRMARENEQKAILTERISKTYLIAEEPASQIVKAAYNAAHQYHLDPVLLLSIIAVESRFNPYAQSNAGAVGLAQIIPKWHPQHIENLEKKGLEQDPLNPLSNIYLAGAIYREYLNWHSNNRVKALQQYNGSLNDPTRRYSNKVLEVYDRLQQDLPRTLEGPLQPHPQAAQIFSQPTPTRTHS